MKERVIYLKDLFYYICRKWRIALILMLVFALVLNFYGWYRAKKAADASASSHRDELEALRENLTEKQIFDAEDRARNYFVYYRQYLDQGQYMENSVYFKLDPTAVPVFRAEYLAENWAGRSGGASESGSEPVADVLIALRAVAESDEVLDRIAEVLDMQDRKQYVRELYNTEAVGSGMTVTVYGETEVKAKKAGAVLVDVLKEAAEELPDSLKDESVILLGTRCYTAADPKVGGDQEKAIAHSAVLENIMNASGNNLPSAAKSYYEALLNDNMNEVVPESGDESKKIGKVFPKWIIVGLLLGFLLYVVCAALIYILSEKIKTAEEVEEYFGIRVLSQVKCCTKRKNFLDRFVDWIFTKKQLIFDEEDGVRSILDRIVYRAGYEDGEQLLLCTDAGDETANSIAAKLVVGLEEKGVQARIKEDVFVSPAMMEILRSAKGVIFFKHLGKSAYTSLMKELDAIRDADAVLVGSVILRD